ncbi:helix-turn-helix transcriptional regulator [Sphingosinicellaceae bacterium]|nr:helix-turn-helix transcriptional regulator [Sphingosinicellaceae bacterium]
MTSDRLVDADATRRLRERQSECLRLMARCRTPKEIATDLELSVETVHAHLKAARRTLAVGSSRQAARILADAELFVGQSMGTHALGIASRLSNAEVSGEERGNTSDRTQDELATFSDSWTAISHQPIESRESPRSLRGRLDDLSPLQRIVLMGIALATVVIVIAGLSATATSLQSMLWSIYYRR